MCRWTLTCRTQLKRKEVQRTERLRPKPLWWPADPGLSLESQTLPQTPCLSSSHDADQLLNGSWASPALLNSPSLSCTMWGFTGGFEVSMHDCRRDASQSAQSFEKRAESITCNSYSWRRFRARIGIKHLHASHINVPLPRRKSLVRDPAGYFVPQLEPPVKRGEKTAGQLPDRMCSSTFLNPDTFCAFGHKSRTMLEKMWPWSTKPVIIARVYL